MEEVTLMSRSIVSAVHSTKDATPPHTVSQEATHQTEVMSRSVMQYESSSDSSIRYLVAEDPHLAIGTVVTSVLPNPLRFHCSGEGLKVAEVGKSSTAIVHAVNYLDCPCKETVQSIRCHLMSELTGVTVRGSTERTGQSQYEISYQPTVKGRHQLHITVNEQEVGESPFPVCVSSPVETMGTLLHSVQNLDGPWGVVINEQRELMVTEFGTHVVSLLSPVGAKFHSFGTFGSNPGEFNGIHGVTVDGEGNIIVVDNGNSRIQKFSPNGEFIKSAGTQGKGPLKFSCIQGVSYNRFNNKLYVVDWNNCIQILNSDLTYSGTFGKEGRKKGQFDHPWDVACDGHSGKVYVSDTDNHRVQVFTAEGHFVRAVGCKGEGKMSLKQPMGLCVGHTSLLYVGNSSNKVAVFSPEGERVKSFVVCGEGRGREGSGGDERGCGSGLAYPCGLAVDECGLLYVCDGINNRINIY